MLAIVVTASHGQRAVESHHEVAKPRIKKRSAELDVVPSFCAAEGIHDHLLEHRAVRDKGVQPRHKGVGQIDGTLAAPIGVGAVEVKAGNHSWPVQFAG